MRGPLPSPRAGRPRAANQSTDGLASSSRSLSEKRERHWLIPNQIRISDKMTRWPVRTRNRWSSNVRGRFHGDQPDDQVEQGHQDRGQSGRLPAPADRRRQQQEHEEGEERAGVALGQQHQQREHRRCRGRARRRRGGRRATSCSTSPPGSRPQRTCRRWPGSRSRAALRRDCRVPAIRRPGTTQP